jgi:hypothetical protein
MHIKTMNGAELNGRRFTDGTILDLPEAEAAVLIENDMAEILGGDEPTEGDGDAEGQAQPGAPKRKRATK